MRAVVIYDGACPTCRRWRKLGGALDWLRLLEWLPAQDKRAAGFGVPVRSLLERMHVAAGKRLHSGYAALKAILLRLPAFYLLAAAAVLTAPWIALPLYLLFAGWTEPFGQRLYDRFARSRRR